MKNKTRFLEVVYHKEHTIINLWQKTNPHDKMMTDIQTPKKLESQLPK